MRAELLCENEPELRAEFYEVLARQIDRARAAEPVSATSGALLVHLAAVVRNAPGLAIADFAFTREIVAGRPVYYALHLQAGSPAPGFYDVNFEAFGDGGRIYGVSAGIPAEFVDK